MPSLLSSMSRDIQAPSHSVLQMLSADDSRPFVLTHSNLNPLHFVVGDDGILWLIGFGRAGFFPEWWEFVAMRRQAVIEEHEGLRGHPDPSWDAIIPLACARCYVQTRAVV